MTEYNFINEFEIQAKENQLELAHKFLDEFLELDDYILYLICLNGFLITWNLFKN